MCPKENIKDKALIFPIRYRQKLFEGFKDSFSKLAPFLLSIPFLFLPPSSFLPFLINLIF